MKSIVLLSFLLLLGIESFSQRVPNQSTPRNTLEEFFRAARTGNFETLHLLCDPEGKNDGDTKRICALHESSKEERIKYMRSFNLAYSVKEEIISEQAASVTFKFGPRAQLSETMQLIKRNNKWYLSSF